MTKQRFDWPHDYAEECSNHTTNGSKDSSEYTAYNSTNRSNHGCEKPDPKRKRDEHQQYDQ